MHVQFAPSAFGFSPWIGLLPDLVAAPVVGTLHEYGWWSAPRRVPERAWRVVERRGWFDRETWRLAPAGRAAVVTNAGHARVLADRLGIEAVRIPLAPNVPDLGSDLDPAPDQVRRRLGVPVDAEVIGFFGFVHPVKGVRYLIEALAALRAAGRTRLHLLVLGGFTSLALPAAEAAAFRAELLDRARRAGVDRTSRSPGTCPAAAVSAALHACDLAAFPFTAGATTKSGALLSAFAHRLPTVVTAADPPDPQLVDGRTVVVAPRVRSADALVTAIGRLLDDAALRARVAAGGAALGAAADLAPDRRRPPAPVRGRAGPPWLSGTATSWSSTCSAGWATWSWCCRCVHALARRNPGATLRLLTHAPGDELVRADPAVTEIRRAERGAERAAVRAELDRRRPDLVVSTTRYDGIADEISARGVRCVTDLWRRPPPDQPVTDRYLRILLDEGLIDETDARPAIRLTAAEQRAGRDALARCAPTGSPVVLIPGAGMAVKRWPHWPELVTALVGRGCPPLVVTEPGGPSRSWAPAEPVPPTDLRGLAALFAAVGHRGGTVVGPDTGPLRVAAAVGARTVGLFGPTAATRYGLPAPAVDLQGLPGLPAPPPDRDHRAGLLVGRALPAGQHRPGLHGRAQSGRGAGRGAGSGLTASTA